jgi:hypothetical protein
VPGARSSVPRSGDPTAQTLTTRAKAAGPQNTVLNSFSPSDWFSGKTILTEPRELEVLIRVLTDLAGRIGTSWRCRIAPTVRLSIPNCSPSLVDRCTCRVAQDEFLDLLAFELLGRGRHASTPSRTQRLRGLGQPAEQRFQLADLHLCVVVASPQLHCFLPGLPSCIRCATY